MAKIFTRARMRWRFTRPWFRFFLAFVSTAAAVIGVYVGLRKGVDVDSTAASVLVAIVFGVATVILNQQAQRRRNTIDLVSKLVESDRVAGAELWLADRALRGQRITAEVIESPEDRHKVATVLDHYDLLSTLARRGLIDVGMVVDLHGGGMAWAFEQCRPYIEHRRSNDSPWLYSEYELFVLTYLKTRNAKRHAVVFAPTPRSAGPASEDREMAPA
jgi:hypothetical protein